MVAPEAARIALMAIRPEYAQAIMQGTKAVEFRRRPLAADVRTVLIYETSPTKQIVGEFTVGEVVIASPSELWRKFRGVGGITEEAFTAYYVEASKGAAITISKVKSYDVPVKLSDLNSQPAVPQSFCYLDADVLAELSVDARMVERKAS